MKYSKIPVAQSIVRLCVSKGIHQVVISPGSRNAPLTISFINHPEITPYSIVDERCAGFFALGIAQKTRQPVALVCTSGSALLNYYPAVSEAFYSDIPLVVISADRPVERIDIGDGQTIRQKNVFANHIAYSANLYSEIVPEMAVQDTAIQQKLTESRRHNEQEINKALNTAIEQRGPVHINVPFYEPLYATTDTPAAPAIAIAPKLTLPEITNEELKPYARIWNNAKRKMILVGVLPPHSIEQHFIDTLGESEDVIVFTETTSNVHHPHFFTRIDNMIGSLDEEGFKALQPEILLTMGGMVISKKIKSFLRHYQPEHHWHIDTKKAYDTYFCLNRHFKKSPNDFFGQFLGLTQAVPSDYQAQWLSVRAHRDTLHERYIQQMPWCDFKAFDLILKSLANDTVLQLGNSSAVRYAQLFDINKTLEVYCNRGTSGIDGSTSTAIGFAVASQKPVTLITGDLSFFYDSNALWNAYTPPDFRVIVVNNGGGGIFRILPNKDKGTTAFDTYFETTHQLNAKALCEMYQWTYVSVCNEEDYAFAKAQLHTKTTRPVLIEIHTPRTLNDEVLLKYFDFIK